ncbi:MAG: hypothetical protein JSU82_05895 [Rhodospirillales bacterium]|nr:MAG: hypothetical protein JSU82_05895 [Rhodospirillales bacterium]
MRRLRRTLASLLILSIVAVFGYAIWPKYGICLASTRYDEIACLARRNLHFSAHMTWSFNRYTVDAAMAEIGTKDIPVLVEMLGDDRAVLSGLAGYLLAKLGPDGLAALNRAAESPDPEIRRAARSALIDYEIIRSQPPPQN